MSTAPRAVRQCIAGVALPTARRQWGRALQELHCPLPRGSGAVYCRSCTAYCPQGSEAVHCRSSTTHCPLAVRQCIAGVALPTAPGSPAVHCRTCTPHCSMRRHSSAGQVRQCTGPAMQQHTYTQRAHDTDSPARLPVPVGRHPGHCLLVTAPLAHQVSTLVNKRQGPKDTAHTMQQARKPVNKR